MWQHTVVYNCLLSLCLTNYIIHSYMYIYIIYNYAHVYIYIYTHIYIYTYKYTDIYIYTYIDVSWVYSLLSLQRFRRVLGIHFRNHPTPIASKDSPLVIRWMDTSAVPEMSQRCAVPPLWILLKPWFQWVFNATGKGILIDQWTVHQTSSPTWNDWY